MQPLAAGTVMRRSEAAPPPVRSRRDLHPHLRDQQGPNALRPLPEAQIADRIRRRGKGLQANRRQPVQWSLAPLVKGRSQRLARRRMPHQEQPLARLPQLEGLQCRSRLTKKRETPSPHAKQTVDNSNYP